MKHIEISKENPIIRLPRDFVEKVEPDKRKKKVKLFITVSDNKITIQK